MEDEFILKQKYNSLLESLKIGEKYVQENPDDEKAKKKLAKIGDEMQKIMKLFPDMTTEEMENGFNIVQISEQVNAQANTQVNTQANTQVIQTTITDPTNSQIVRIKQPKSLESTSKTNTLQNFSNTWEIASKLAKSTIIPENYKGKPENIIIALGLANQMQLDPFIVMQNLAIIKGKTSWSGSFCKTLIERTGKFKNLELNYIGEKGKDSYGCYLSAVRVSDNKIIKGPEVTMEMAKAEKWTSNSKWHTLTDLMLAYRCQSFFCRIYVPEAMYGIYTSDEVEEIEIDRQQPQDIL